MRRLRISARSSSVEAFRPHSLLQREAHACRACEAGPGFALRAKEIVIVDDASTDGTREMLKNRDIPGVDRVILLDKNQGKGAALRAGLSAVSGDVVVIQDADLEYDPANYGKLLQPILDGHADVVYGSRFKRTRCSSCALFLASSRQWISDARLQHAHQSESKRYRDGP